MDDSTGIVFEQRDGRRSTSAVGREVVAAALAPVDPVGAAAARRESSWRTGYPQHFRRLVEAGMARDGAEVDIARAGLVAVHERMRWAADGTDHPLDDALTTGATPATGRVVGAGERETELTLPYRGERLRGSDLRRRLDDWVADGVIEPGARAAVLEVMTNPQWLDLRDTTIAVLGAGAEMGPLWSVLRWGARTLAVDLPRPDVWRRLGEHAAGSAGSLLFPVVGDGPGDDIRRAGADLLHDTGSVARWLGSVEGPLVLGNYVYADAATNVRLATAVDLVGERLRAERDDLALAFLATPTDVFVVPEDAVAQSCARYGAPSVGGLVRGPLRLASRGRLLRRQYAPGEGPGISDSIVAQQGPNYLLAKRIHRWRATAAAADGLTVSMNIAPPTRTRSVTKNRALAAAYAGAHRFGIEVFEPATSNTLMAALLVHDIRRGGTPGAGWRAEAAQACHGGLWRAPYDPRSALGIAAVLGLGAARH